MSKYLFIHSLLFLFLLAGGIWQAPVATIPQAVDWSIISLLTGAFLSGLLEVIVGLLPTGLTAFLTATATALDNFLFI